MREERLFRILGQIDADIIETADISKSGYPKVRCLKPAGWAASFVLLAGLGSYMLAHTPVPTPNPYETHLPILSPSASHTPGNTSAPETTPALDTTPTATPTTAAPADTPATAAPTGTPAASPTTTPAPTLIDGLPALTLQFFSDGMGYEGYMAHSYEELTNANPWSQELGITHLPVFRNNIAYDEHYMVTDPNWDGLEAQLRLVAEHMGLTDLTLDRIEDKSFPMLEATSGDITLRTSFDMITTIYDEDTPALLPDSAVNYADPYHQAAHIAKYLSEEYTDFLAMETPTINISGGDYNIYDTQSFRISFFDGCEDPVQRILNYNFHQVYFYYRDKELYLFRVYHTDLSNVVGNYPIISDAEAKALLIDNVYATTVPYAFPGEEYICGVELVYRSHNCDEYFLPYYRFYVELPEAQTSEEYLTYGLNTYGAYYVPAVEGKYIENMDALHLNFN